MNDGEVVIGTELDTKGFDAQIEELEDKLDTLVQEYESALKDKEFPEDELKKYRSEIEKTTNKIIALKHQQDKLSKTDFSRIPQVIGNVGNSVDKVTRKIGRWAVAIFGVATAYGFIRRAMSTIISQDEQLSADIEYMKNALAYTLEPLVRKIVELAKQLMFYVGYVIKAWTGKNIFENANKSLKNANKEATKLSKTLAGFDEMNILQDSSSGSGGGTTTPSFDLSNIDNMNPPDWLTWIVDHKSEILSTLFGIATALGLIKIGIDPLTASGIGVTLGGIAYTIMKILDYLNDPSWENFGGVITGIGIAITGLGILILGLPGIIAGVIIAIGGLIISNWEKIKEFLIEKIEWLTDKSDWIREHLGDVVGDIYDNFVTMFKMIVINLDTNFKDMKAMFDELIKFIDNVFKGKWKEAWKNLIEIGKLWLDNFKTHWKTVFGIIGTFVVNTMTNIGATIGDALKAVINGIIYLIESRINSAITMINGALGLINVIPGVTISTVKYLQLPRLARGGIINQPGRGVMVGGAIAGERGQEGILPLTDSQQMELLGEAIGRYITINANITNTMNGRVISKELKKISAEDNFAFNR